MRAALIKDGKVTNLIVVEGEVTPERFPGYVPVPDDTPCGIGWDYVGGVFTELVVPPTAEALAAAKARQRQLIEQARDAARHANVTALGTEWQADALSQNLIGQAITLAQAGLLPPPVWRDAANNDVAITSVFDLLQIAGAMAAATQAAYAKSWRLKAEIDAATTLAQVEAVQWNS